MFLKMSQPYRPKKNKNQIISCLEVNHNEKTSKFMDENLKVCLEEDSVALNVNIQISLLNMKTLGQTALV